MRSKLAKNLFAAIAGLCLGITAYGAEKSGLVVHEWGVLVRRNTFPETIGGANELLDSLPGFVGRHAGYIPETTMRPWRKPVLHFYGKEQEISVEVLTPTGRPVAYWPNPVLLEETFWLMGQGLKDAVGMRWEGKLTKAKPKKIQGVPDDHWWAKIRDVGGLWLETSEGVERFLFYEGTGMGEPMVAASFEGDRLHLKNRDIKACGPVLVIVNDGVNRHLGVVEKIGPAGKASLEKDKLMADPVTRAELRNAAKEQWLSFGMTEEEAAMIVSLWEDDLWENRGFLVISRMPPRIYDKYIFPIKIEPEPDELLRAAVIFDTLPRVKGRSNWLPGLAPQIEKLLVGLSSADPKQREEATAGIASYGDLALDLLEEESIEGDVESRMRVKRLIEKLDPKLAPNLPIHLGRGADPNLKIPNEIRLGPLIGIVGMLEEGSPGKYFLVHEQHGRFPVVNLNHAKLDMTRPVHLRGRFVPPNYGLGPTPEDRGWIFDVAR